MPAIDLVFIKPWKTGNPVVDCEQLVVVEIRVGRDAKSVAEPVDQFRHVGTFLLRDDRRFRRPGTRRRMSDTGDVGCWCISTASVGEHPKVEAGCGVLGRLGVRGRRGSESVQPARNPHTAAGCLPRRPRGRRCGRPASTSSGLLRFRCSRFHASTLHGVAIVEVRPQDGFVGHQR